VKKREPREEKRRRATEKMGFAADAPAMMGTGLWAKKVWGRDDRDRRTKDLAFAVLLRSRKKNYRIRYYLSS
jgi:hypothetical protein